MQTPVEARLASQWPKRCSCCHSAIVDSAAWSQLKYVGELQDVFATLALRDCPCGSTLAVITQIHDLGAE